jgi:hypothetical protein
MTMATNMRAATMTTRTESAQAAKRRMEAGSLEHGEWVAGRRGPQVSLGNASVGLRQNGCSVARLFSYPRAERPPSYTASSGEAYS